MADPRRMVDRAARAVRSWPPFNRPVTAAVRALCRATGHTPEWVVAHVHRLGTVRTPLPDGRTLVLRSKGDDWVSNQVYWRGWLGYEPETTAVFRRLAARSRATIDVGAYVGFYALVAAHACPDAPVVAIEPQPAAADRLRAHVRLNALANVRVVEAAAGAADGSAELFLTPGLPTSCSLSREFMAGVAGAAPLTVRVRSIDSLVAEAGIGAVDLVKIDTESTEPDVLRGMTGTLERDRPDVVCEVLTGRSTGPRIDAILRPLGYRYYLLTAAGPKEDASLAGDPQWLNYLFTTRRP